jgi:hypothetical protein
MRSASARAGERASFGAGEFFGLNSPRDGVRWCAGVSWCSDGPSTPGRGINTPLQDAQCAAGLVSAGWWWVGRALGRGVMYVRGAYRDVVRWGVVFAVVISAILTPRPPVDDKLALLNTIPDPVEAHVDRAGSLLLDGVIRYAACR